ncbi:MAG: hypothetical protein GXO33_00375 [Epsilonproteobacteria bacterium]|jgi:hypothetical protein|nr:hypothetical protein [Campylobacterota bacterium]
MNGYEEKHPVDLSPPLTRRCLWLARALHTLFHLVPALLGVWIALQTVWFYGLVAFLAGHFAGTIVLSKLKLAHVPPNQHELPHAASAILKWTAWRLCP